MKKVTALLGAFLLSSTFMVPVHATGTQDITTTDGTKEQEGTVYGSLSGSALKQLKVTVPIKLDFAVAPVITTPTNDTAAPAAPNVVYNGDYKIKVAADSEVGVELEKVNIKKIGGWSLDTKANVDALNVDGTDQGAALIKAKTVALNLAGKELKEGDTTYGANEFAVAVSAEKSLGLSGTAGKVWISEASAATPESAFTITYTIKQK